VNLGNDAGIVKTIFILRYIHKEKIRRFDGGCSCDSITQSRRSAA